MMVKVVLKAFGHADAIIESEPKEVKDERGDDLPALHLD